MKTGVITFKAGIMLLGGTNHGGKLKGDVSGWRGYIEPRTAADFTAEIKARLGGGPVRLDVHEDEYPALEEAVSKLRAGCGYSRHADKDCDASGFGRFVVIMAGESFPKNDASGTARMYYSLEEITRIFSQTYMDYRALWPDAEKTRAMYVRNRKNASKAAKLAPSHYTDVHIENEFRKYRERHSGATVTAWEACAALIRPGQPLSKYKKIKGLWDRIGRIADKGWGLTREAWFNSLNQK